jgi:hypothetical protein
MKKLVLAIVVSFATTTTAQAFGPWRLAGNGTQVSGVALEGLKVNGIDLRTVTVVTKDDKEAQKK